MPDNHVPTPHDLRAISAEDLLNGWLMHNSHLVRARHASTLPEPAVRLRGDALDALVCGAALVERLNDARWCTAVDALRYGARLADIAAALGMPTTELRMALVGWARVQLGLNVDSNGQLGLTLGEHDELVRLLREDGAR